MGGSKKKKPQMPGNLSRKLKYEYDDDDLDYYDDEYYSNDDDVVSGEDNCYNETTETDTQLVTDTLNENLERTKMAEEIVKNISPFYNSNIEFPDMGITSKPFPEHHWNIWNSKLLVDTERKATGLPPGFENILPVVIDESGCTRPKIKARYIYHETSDIEQHKPNFTWEPAKWIKCEKCSLWHSNREIPKGYLTSGKWKVRKGSRKKVGIILIRERPEGKQIWMIQSYNNCFGFPKGEKEVDESESECAIREFREETGWNINIDLGKRKYLTHKIENILYMFYIVHMKPDFDITTVPEDDVEITTFGWCNVNNIPNLKLSKVGRVIFRKWQSTIENKIHNKYYSPNKFKAFEKKRKTSVKPFYPKIIHQPVG
jgi:8-oxo-dGTP pyrophosphatase MutT (NUDIX family)